MYKILLAFLALVVLACSPARGQTDTTRPLPVDTSYAADSGYVADSTMAVDTTYHDSTEWVDEYEEESDYHKDGDELLNEEVDYDFSSDFGPNEENYFHSFYGIGLVAGPSDTGVHLNYGVSYLTVGGLRYKRKLSGMFAVCLEIGGRYGEFNISQPHRNYFLDTTFWHKSSVNHRREKMTSYGLDAGGALRINFDPKRGNYMGRYLDLGANGSFVLTRTYITVDDLPEARLRSKFTGFPYINPFQYELTGKLGFNVLALFVRYRMSNFFKEQYHFPEFARIVVGLELNIPQ